MSEYSEGKTCHSKVEITQLPMRVTHSGDKSGKNFLPGDLTGQVVNEVVNDFFNNIASQ